MYVKLEKNIPIPPKRSVKSPKISKYRALDKAEVGDSMLVKHFGQARYVYTKMQNKGWTATSRKVENGVRVWRTS